MERLARDDALAVHDLVIADVIHLGMAFDVALALVVGLQLPEQLRRGHELLRAEMLVADDQDVMIGQRAVERSARLSVDPPGDVEPAHCGAGMLRQWRDGKGVHGLLPRNAR